MMSPEHHSSLGWPLLIARLRIRRYNTHRRQLTPLQYCEVAFHCDQIDATAVRRFHRTHADFIKALLQSVWLKKRV
jgi:hypothetical protein